MYVSLGFLVVIIRVPVWATYLEILNNSQLVRRYVLENDNSRTRRSRRLPPLTAEEQRIRSLQQLTTTAFHAAQDGQYLAAIDNYTQAIKSAEAAPSKIYVQLYKANLAEALNNLAWLLATCSEAALREPKTAVAYARRAVELQPQNGNYWNTLGVAYYRSSDWQLAHDALHQSLKLRNDGDAFDWFFLALVDLKLGRNNDQARVWYDKAVLWFHIQRPLDPELYRFQVEAATALGLPTPVRAASMEAAGGRGLPTNVYSLTTRGAAAASLRLRKPPRSERLVSQFGDLAHSELSPLDEPVQVDGLADSEHTSPTRRSRARDLPRSKASRRSRLSTHTSRLAHKIKKPSRTRTVMRQAAKTIVIGFSLALAPAAGAGGGGADSPGSVAQARRLVEANDHAAALVLLEDLLLEADAKDKPEVLDLLRKTYDALAHKAAAEGRERDAAHFRDNIAIIERGQAKKSAPRADERAPQRPTPAAIPKRPAKTDGEVKQARLPAPRASDSPATSPQPAPATSPPRAPAAAAPLRARSTDNENAERPATVKTARPELTPADADRLFTAKRYDEAGRIYAALARQNSTARQPRRALGLLPVRRSRPSRQPPTGVCA